MPAGGQTARQVGYKIVPPPGLAGRESPFGVDKRARYEQSTKHLTGGCLAGISVLFACHLTSVPNSGGNTQFWQNIGLQKIPDAHNSNKDKNSFHWFILFS